MWMDVKVLNVDNKVSLSTVRCCCCCCCKLRGRLLRVLICRSPTQFQSAADHLLRVIYCKKTVGNQILTPPPIGERSIVMSVSVCLSVRDHIFGTTRPILLSPIFYARYLWSWLGPPLVAK